jgi:hypothetical protein
VSILRWDGAKIARAGIYADLPITEYHGQPCAGPSISSTGLRTIFSKSPAHYWVSSSLNPKRVEQAESEALTFGRAAHHLLLGEAGFRDVFAVLPEDAPRRPTSAQLGAAKPSPATVEQIRWWREFEQANGHKTLLTMAQIEAIRGMAESLAGEPLVRAGILNGLIEHSIVWRDRETGIWLKIRPDAIPDGSVDFADLKTAADITDDGIERAVGDYGLNMQGALVGMGAREVLGVEMTSFTLLFVEKAPPFCVRAKTLKPHDLELGERQIRAALRVFAACLETNRWPGPGGEQTDAEFVEIKPYARARIEARLALMEQGLAA